MEKQKLPKQSAPTYHCDVDDADMFPRALVRVELFQLARPQRQ